MPKRTLCLCSLSVLLMSLCLAPVALALGTEKTLPDTSLACPPVSGGGNYGGAGVRSATSPPSIQDVWMQQGGARLYYSAQYAPRQQYTGGASHIDPACLPLLPPLRAWGAPAPKKKTYRRTQPKAAVPCPEVANTTTSTTSKAGVAPSAASAKATGAAKDGAVAASGKSPDKVTGAASKNKPAVSRAEAIARAKAASDAETARLMKGGANKVAPKDAPEKVLH